MSPIKLCIRVNQMRRNLLKNVPISLRHYSSTTSNVLRAGEILKQARTFSDSDIAEYSKLTHDSNPLHFDSECAQLAGFRGVLVPGMLVASLFPRIIASHFPGAVYVKQMLEFRSPVFVGDEIVGQVETMNVREMKGKFMAKFATTCFREGGGVVIAGEATAILPTLSMT